MTMPDIHPTRMRPLRPVRVIAATALLSVPVATLALAGPASARTPTISCKTLFADATNGRGTLSGCSQAATGGSGTLSSFMPSGGSVSWNNGTTTNFTTTSSGETETHKAHRCPAATQETDLHGTVTTSDNSSIPGGGSVTMEVCVSYALHAITNKPHTKVVFGG